MTKYKGKTVTTWADGFGNWHARVDLPDTGYGNTGELAIDRHWDAIRAAARRAIRAEVLERQSGPIAPVRIEVEQQGVYASSNVWHSVTFHESTR